MGSVQICSFGLEDPVKSVKFCFGLYCYHLLQTLNYLRGGEVICGDYYLREWTWVRIWQNSITGLKLTFFVHSVMWLRCFKIFIRPPIEI